MYDRLRKPQRPPLLLAELRRGKGGRHDQAAVSTVRRDGAGHDQRLRRWFAELAEPDSGSESEPERTAGTSDGVGTGGVQSDLLTVCWRTHRCAGHLDDQSLLSSVRAKVDGGEQGRQYTAIRC